MKVGGQLVEFCPCGLLLQFCLFQSSFVCIFFKLLSHFFILRLDMLQITLSSIEVMFVFSAIITSIVLLNYFSLLIKEFGLFILIFKLLLIHELATATIASPYSLYLLCGPLLLLVIPLDPQHSNVFLYYDSSVSLLGTVFLCLI